MAQALLVILVQVGADISSNYQQQHEEFYLINIGPEHVKLSQEKQHFIKTEDRYEKDVTIFSGHKQLTMTQCILTS